MESYKKLIKTKEGRKGKIKNQRSAMNRKVKRWQIIIHYVNN